MKKNKKANGKLLQTLCWAGFSPCSCFGFKRGWLFVYDLFSCTGSSFRSAMEYCDEQYWYHVGKTMQKK